MKTLDLFGNKVADYNPAAAGGATNTTTVTFHLSGAGSQDQRHADEVVSLVAVALLLSVVPALTFRFADDGMMEVHPV